MLPFKSDRSTFIAEAGNLLGIKLLDHVIVSTSEHMSFQANGSIGHKTFYARKYVRYDIYLKRELCLISS